MHFFFSWIIETNSLTKSIDQMLYNPSQALKIIILCRLTPIPFGLQNSLFSVHESLSAWLYCYATFLGLMPFQVLNVYLGSTLRSMEQVSFFHDKPVITARFQLPCKRLREILPLSNEQNFRNFTSAPNYAAPSEMLADRLSEETKT